MKKVLHLSLFLSGLMMVVTLVGILAYEFTSPIIEQNKNDKIKESIALLFDDNEYSRNENQIEIYNVSSYDLISGVYEVIDLNGDINYIIYDVSVYGKNGDIYTLVAIDLTNDFIDGVVYYQHSETPGIGALYTEDIEIEKLYMPIDDFETVDYIAGATVTHRALDQMFLEIKTHYLKEVE